MYSDNRHYAYAYDMEYDENMFSLLVADSTRVSDMLFEYAKHISL